MSTQTRALLIALIGPALSILGALWVLANVLIDTGRELTLRYVVFDPGHLVIASGVMVTIVSIPVAFQVAVAEPEEVGLHLPEPQQDEQPSEAPVGVPGRTSEATE
jgi:hypothetical protein